VEETMGMGGISIWQLLIILVIVLLLFGTKRLKSLGSDLGNAIKGFRSAMSDSEKEEEAQKRLEESSPPPSASATPSASRTATPDPAARVEDKDKV
jgi:sec-independent protein translocase protein TatA